MEPDKQHPVAVLPVALSAWQDQTTTEIQLSKEENKSSKFLLSHRIRTVARI